MIRIAHIQASELRSWEARLDGFFYAGVGRSVRLALETSDLKVDRLAICAEPPFMGNRFARHYVHNPEFGIAFLGPSQMRLMESHNPPLISRAKTPNLERLRIQRGWILISRSGAVGNFAYVRADIEGMIGSDDLIRIVPRKGGAPCGYIYAFLCSEPGLSMLKQWTYGGVISHIEPHHVAGLLIPRLASPVELSIHDLIEQASTKRVDANKQLTQAGRLLQNCTGIPQDFLVRSDHGFAIGQVQASEIKRLKRLDAYYYIGHAGEVRGWTSDKVPTKLLGAIVARVFDPPIFRRIRVQAGIPYLLGAETYLVNPRASSKIYRGTPNLNAYILHKDMIIFEDAGQRYGLLGTPVYVGRSLSGYAATNNMMRIVPYSREDAGFLFALFRSDYGRRLILRQSYGTSLPHIFPKDISELPVPWPAEDKRILVAEPVLRAVELRDEANDLENEAQEILASELGRAVPELLSIGREPEGS